MLDPTRRFSTRVENYVRYRPHYPDQVLRILVEECGLSRDWRIADIGSGTGISTELFLANGNSTIGVEPNQPMREAAEALLSPYTGFISADGTAEATGLPDSSIDMVVAGQAFHWFDRTRAKDEFDRILRPGGWVVLFWNERLSTGTPFLDAYEKLLRDCAPEYEKVEHRRIDDSVLSEFYAPGQYRTRVCSNQQSFDFDGLKGRLLSSSYAPEYGHPLHEPMIAELARIFAQHNMDGRVLFRYETCVHYGQLHPQND